MNDQAIAAGGGAVFAIGISGSVFGVSFAVLLGAALASMILIARAENRTKTALAGTAVIAVAAAAIFGDFACSLLSAIVSSFFTSFKIPAEAMRMPIGGIIALTAQKVLLPGVDSLVESAFKRGKKEIEGE